MAWLLLPLALLDWRHFWLPDRLILLLAGTGLMHILMTFDGQQIWTGLLTAIVSYLILEAVRRLFFKLRGFEGMGAGDPKLFGALMFWLNWQQAPWLILGASILGLVVMGVKRILQLDGGNKLPFGYILCSMGWALFVLQYSKF